MLRRDLPFDSLIELTVSMDEAQQLRAQVFVPALDQDFEVTFDLKIQHSSLEELRKQVQQQKVRLANAREKAERMKAIKADAAVSRIDDEQLVDQVDSLMDAASQDQDALAQLDRKTLDLAAASDELEDSLNVATAPHPSNEIDDEVHLDIVEFGIYATSYVPVADDAQATGFQNRVHFVSLVQQTDVIPLRRGLSFGVTWLSRGVPSGQAMEVRTIWKYPTPGIRNIRTGKMHATSEMIEVFTAGAKTPKTYSFDEDCELLDGAWHLEVWFKDRKIGEKSLFMRRVSSVSGTVPSSKQGV